jgi:predicted Rossmann fold flavoprotein
LRADVVILGAGAAGLFCAFHAARRGRRVLVLEHNQEPGRKILISGGGRCNFTNIDTRPENFLSANPHFAKSALARYTSADFIALVEKHGIAWHEKKLGQLFCDHSAREITNMLLRECAAAQVDIRTGCRVTNVTKPAHFEVETTAGNFQTESVVIATGGLSIPKIGATSIGYDIARQFGLKIEPCRPALVPLTFNKQDRDWTDLAGVAAESIASINGTSFREKLLFTHRGLSGPAILQISSYWSPGHSIAVDLLPGVDLTTQLAERRARGDTAELKTALAELLPARLAERWFATVSRSKPIARASNQDFETLDSQLHEWLVTPGGTEGYEKAEVTAGGVSTAELSSKTMEARQVPGLFFIGEVVDVTGHLGGYNFQWAWASAFAAAQAV